MDSRAIMLKILQGEFRASKLTVRELAKRADTNERNLSGILNGHKGFGVDLYQRLLLAMGREPVYSTRPVCHCGVPHQ